MFLLDIKMYNMHYLYIFFNITNIFSSQIPFFLALDFKVNTIVIQITIQQQKDVSRHCSSLHISFKKILITFHRLDFFKWKKFLMKFGYFPLIMSQIIIKTIRQRILRLLRSDYGQGQILQCFKIKQTKKPSSNRIIQVIN